MSLHNLPEHHRRLLADALTAGRPYGLALMGGYAVRAHGIVHRPSQDLDFATQHPADMSEIIEQITDWLTGKGWRITVVDVAPLKARFLAARRPDEFDLGELHDRLESLEWISDAEFEAYGMDTPRIRQLRQWAQHWLDDLAQRLAEPYDEAPDT
ncbi:nucleotidyl transferase AbiEii/AbiGii toxin family protein [Streptomyces sp. NPDC090106]|uniref:nucleotidyl transferase AbiEii/AbiGii toxin family protein n=1 Tax=Streptomyces sp. NPDC090106 TaxID=3365946 RepID=UPI0038270948